MSAHPEGAPPLALTQGDPAGIGLEIALKAWLAREAGDIPPFFVLADPRALAATAAALGLSVPLESVAPGEAAACFASALPVVDLHHPAGTRPGRPDPQAAAGVIESIERAVALVRAGEAGAVVTNPIAKHVLYEAGFAHPGHTEFLAELAAPPGASPPRPVMLLYSEDVAVVPVTIHVPLRRVPELLTKTAIVETARIVAKDMRERFGIPSPRLALAGLNPHAGENGAMGDEDERIIAPAVAELRADGIDARGPLPADTMFHAAARKGYDVALCMYHDQALIPVKTLAFDTAVNVTLGLPFLRTSPDHGTAFDIADRGIARPDSLIAALRLAGRLARPAAR